MNKKIITPNPQQPVDRISTGQLPPVLAELQEDNLTASHVLPAGGKECWPSCGCSFDGDDE